MGEGVVRNCSTNYRCNVKGFEDCGSRAIRPMRWNCGNIVTAFDGSNFCVVSLEGTEGTSKLQIAIGVALGVLLGPFCLHVS